MGADILDLTGQNTETFGHLKEEDVIFELSPRQKTFFDMVKHINTYLRNEYHAIHEFIWNTGYNTISSSMPPRYIVYLIGSVVSQSCARDNANPEV